MKRISVLLAAAFCVGIISTTASATTFFSQGSLAPNLTASWDSIRAGGGSAPANFTSGDTFVIQNTHNMGTTAAWTVSGAGATIQIESGGTLTANNIVAVPTFQVDNGGSYVHNTASGAANGVATDVPGSTTRTFGASSTVEFQKWANGGTGPVALPSAVAWGNLIINVTLLAGSWQQSGGLQTVNGNLTIQQTGGTTREFRLNANSPATSTFNLTGNLQVSGGIFNITSGTAVETFNIGGSFSLSGGTFTATGAGPHSMNFTGGTSSVTFSQPGAGTFTVTNINFTIASGKTVTLNSDFPLGAARSLTVTGTLDQGASFNLTTGTSTAISSGGQLKNLGTGDLTLGGNVTNNGTVNLNGGGVACGDADSILIRSSASPTPRTWSGTGVFDFVDVDVQDQSGSGIIAVSSTDTGNNTGWTFQGSCGPSAARLSSFGARRFEDGTVMLEWQTGFEVDNLGYNIYRDEGGKRARLTPQMIAGSALLAGPRVSLKAGRSYAWTDSLADGKQASYWLEEVDLNGASTWRGPFAVVRAKQGEQLPNGGSVRAVLLSGLNVDGGRQLQTTAVALAAKPVEITAAGLAIQSDLARASALKLAVRREGWYRVSAEELIAAGLDQRIDPRNLRLYADGVEQAFIVKGEEDGRFDPQDAIEFYGIGLDTQATDTRVYWLAAGSEPGRRIEQVKGKGSRAAPSSSPYTVELKERTVYFSALRNGDKENFFGAVIARNPVDQMIRVEHLDTAVAGNATLEIALQGVTEVAHRVKVELNGTTAGEINFTGKKEGVAALAVPQTALKEGQNTVRLTPLGAESDVSLVSYIRITYPHTYTADNNALRFTLANKHQVTIDGFSSAAIRVLDITDPNEIHQVSARVQQQGEGYSVTVSAPKAGGGMLWALADDQARHVAAITPNQPSNLRDAENAADFVIVAHRDFMESVRPLQSLRESQGLKVTVVDVEDVYDEFGYGDKSPRAIKDFLAFAKTNWRTPPRFALFVGDASLDPKNYQGRGDYDFVPARFVDTLLMETVSDEWLADFDGDGLAEMALGRLPVRTAGEASRIIGKIVSYDSAPRSRDILLVSDLNDGIDFQSEFGQVRALVPDDVNVARIDRGALGTSAAKSELIESFNRGFGIVSYFGHGNVDQWRGDLLTSADAGALANGEMRPVVLAITCLNGYFQDPVLDSLAESLMKAERGGAVAVWASSGMCNAGPQAILDQELFRVIFARDESGGGALTLGEAVMRAKNSINDSDVRLTYVLFGDPTSRVK